MRIIKEFSHGLLRCTLLHHNSKYTLRIEDEFGEVNYKLGNIDIVSPDRIPELLNMPEINTSLATAFRSMKSGRDLAVQLLSPINPDEFEEII